MFKKSVLFVMLLVMLLIPISVFADCPSLSKGECNLDKGCTWSEKNGVCAYTNFQNNSTSCGSADGGIKKIPSIIPKVTSIIYTAVQIGVPILLVLFGSLDLIKGVIAAKDDEIKKGQQILIKRLIAGVLVFFVFVLVKFVISVVDDNNDVLDCAECFIENKCN